MPLMIFLSCTFGTYWDLAFPTKHVYIFSGVDLAFFHRKLSSSLLIKDHFMVLVFWIRQMFVSALFTHLLKARIAVVLAIFLAILHATHQKVLASTELW
jgi:hypothetical protein